MKKWLFFRTERRKYAILGGFYDVLDEKGKTDKREKAGCLQRIL